MNTTALVCLGIFSCGILLSQTSHVAGVPAKTHSTSSMRVTRPVIQKLTPYLRAQIAELSVEIGASKWTVMIAGAPGKSAYITQQIAEMGGSIQYRLDCVDYIRARVPLNQIETLVDLPEIEAIDVLSLRPASELPFRYPSTWHIPPHPTVPPVDHSEQATHLKTQTARSAPIPPPDAHLPAINPYLPTRDMGAPQFVAAHPTFDGRGVTIAVVEGVPSLLTPELNASAVTLEGRPTRKLVGIYAPAGPVAENQFRVQWAGNVVAKAGRFTFHDKRYTSPAEGTFRFGTYDVGWIRDTMTQGSTGLTGSSSQVAVLWNAKTNTVWVDTDEDQSFANEKPLHDYNASAEVGTFRTTASAASPDDGIPFAVGIDAQTQSVNLYIGINEHTTEVSSVAVGRGFLHSVANGVAPGARIAVVLSRAKVHGILESLICAMTLSGVDVIFCAEKWGGEASGQEAFNRIVRRLINRYHKPIFASAGNDGPGLTTLSQLAAAPDVIGMGGYISRETSRANLGAVVLDRDYVNNVSSCGPGLDGSFKPDLLAPVSSLAAAQPYDPGNRFYHEHAGMYNLPPGYNIVSGTSYSAPMAAGAAALLISAARQRSIPFDAERLRWALKSGARRLKGYQVYEQGSGLIDVSAAWVALQRAPNPIAIVVRAHVHTAFSKDLPVPDEGVGLYEREGWRAGMRAIRTISLKRTSGSPGSGSYLLNWAGNDGAFHCASSIRLPLEEEVSMPITIHPTATGIHSASLQFREPTSRRVIFEMSATIVAAEPLTAETSYQVNVRGRAEWQKRSVHYFYVPDNASALNFDLALSQGYEATFSLYGPDGQAHSTETTLSPNALYLTAPKPEPGVWEALIENGTTQGTRDIRNVPPLPALYTLRASVTPDSPVQAGRTRVETSIRHTPLLINSGRKDSRKKLHFPERATARFSAEMRLNRGRARARRRAVGARCGLGFR